MDSTSLITGLIWYLYLIPLITFHEFAHAWVAWKCGDHTARLQGRVSLNPIVHMDLVGTVILPLVAVFLGAANSSLAGFIIGWGRPVPVDLNNLRHRRRDDTLVSIAGPAMNLALGLVFVLLAKPASMLPVKQFQEMFIGLSQLSLFLCFFNLLPVPMLDGSHVVKNLIGMSEEVYARLCQYSLFIIIIVLQVPFIGAALNYATDRTFSAMSALVGL
jgi:Zn-dependent protease